MSIFDKPTQPTNPPRASVRYPQVSPVPLLKALDDKEDKDEELPARVRAKLLGWLIDLPQVDE